MNEFSLQMNEQILFSLDGKLENPLAAKIPGITIVLGVMNFFSWLFFGTRQEDQLIVTNQRLIVIQKNRAMYLAPWLTTTISIKKSELTGAGYIEVPKLPFSKKTFLVINQRQGAYMMRYKGSTVDFGANLEQLDRVVLS